MPNRRPQEILCFMVLAVFLMECPAEAFCIFHNAFFSSAISQLMKIKKQRAMKIKKLQSHLSSFTELPFAETKIIKTERRDSTDVALAASDCLGTAIFSRGLC